MLCSVPDCRYESQGRTLCSLHYDRWRRGDVKEAALAFPANPWEGRESCPNGHLTTFPYHPDQPMWHCHTCSVDFTTTTLLLSAPEASS